MLREYVEALEPVDDDQALDDSLALLAEARQAMDHADRLPAERHHRRAHPRGLARGQHAQVAGGADAEAGSISPAIARPAMSSTLVTPAAARG